MLRLLTIALTQSFFLCGGQVLLKLASMQMTPFKWSWHWVGEVATNWWLLACGMSFGIATVLWIYMLKHSPFSQVYPLSSMAYVFGLLAAMAVFGETVPVERWIGVALIVAGCYFIAK